MTSIGTSRMKKSLGTTLRKTAADKNRVPVTDIDSQSSFYQCFNGASTSKKAKVPGDTEQFNAIFFLLH
ncbi:hypothetical protein FH972_009078 [Carpinus fangiana]|uniref:Uncharacterized protein n=1 Tax=Carpinus fangiana TaxID=176857 RepID=A0A5N6R0U0_9ROSI|nr:hypothetical protein FH972_009078 [Carpinus fangiana]